MAGVNGTTYGTFNNAAIQNHGIEVTLGAQGSVGDFSFSGNLNWSYNKNKVTKLYIEAADISSFLNAEYIPGYPIGAMFTYEYGGMENGIPTILDTDGNSYPITDFSIFYMKPEKMMHYQGTMIAPHTVGLNLSVSWKDLTLCAFVNGRFGGKMRMPSFNYGSLDIYGMRSNISAEVAEVMGKDGNSVANPSHMLPLPTTDGEGNAIGKYDYATWAFYYNSMNFSVEKSDYIYLSEIDLNYTLPRSLFTGNKWIKNVDVFGKLENVGLLWSANSKHYHPDYLPGSWEPQLTFTIGANVKF